MNEMIDKKSVNVFIEMKLVQWYKEKTYDWWMKQWKTAEAIIDFCKDNNMEALNQLVAEAPTVKWKQRILDIAAKANLLCNLKALEYKTEYLWEVLNAYKTDKATIETFGIERFFEYNTESGDTDNLEYPPEEWMKEKVKKICWDIEDMVEAIALEDQQRRMEEE